MFKLNSTLPEAVTKAIADVVGPHPVGLHEPRFAGNEWLYLKECLDSTFVSSVGVFVDRFEADLASYTGAKRAVAVVNGTAALQVALQLAGVLAGEEVIVPALTFVGTANSVAHCGATPHFVDSESRTLGLDAIALRDHLRLSTERRSGLCVNRETGRVIRAVVPMHTFGHPCSMELLLGVASEFGLVVVEDAAESLGSSIAGRHTGTFGRLGTLSFNGNKTVTTGGGGAILTNDEELGRRAKHLTTTAKRPHRWAFVHDEVAYNFRMPNLNAALGCAQLEQLPRFLADKRRLHDAYARQFDGMNGVTLVKESEGSISNFWLQALLLDAAQSHLRDSILAMTNDAGYMTRPAWTLMHRLPAFAACPRAPLPVAEDLERRLINIPSSAGLVSAA
jgi:perosamine synthetase